MQSLPTLSSSCGAVCPAAANPLSATDTDTNCRRSPGRAVRRAILRAGARWALCALVLAGGRAGWAQNDKQADKTAEKSGEKPCEAKGAADKNALPPLPAPAHVQQTMELDGKTLHYTVTVGTLPVRDKDGKTAGEVVYTAYIVDG